MCTVDEDGIISAAKVYDNVFINIGGRLLRIKQGDAKY